MKKFLSLALALVMTLSLVTVAGAKEFTDDSKINYAEAVAVVSEAGIIDGYTDGSFNPQGGLTRGAAAKIICNMILGPTTAAALSADAAPFADVPANHVFAGYIAYCAQQGIINGYADGLFRPAGSLTGYQFMKMLLGALGYEGEYEGFVGANWSINVAKLALNLGLEDGNDEFVGTKALTREEACLYAFNTLKADMVEYDSNTSITVGDVVISTSSKAEVIEVKESVDETYADDQVLQFVEKYFKDLWAEDDHDAYGRPALTWWNDDDKIGTYAEEADETIILDKTGVAIDTVLTHADYLNLKDTDVETVKVLVNNVEDEELMAGDFIEVYDDDEDDKYDLAIVTRYHVAKIDTVEDELSKNDVKKGATYAIDLKNLSDDFASVVTGTLYDDHDSKEVLKGFDAETYVKNAVLAVVYGEKVLASNVAETVKGQISAYKSVVDEKATITVDGTKYPVAGAIQGTTDAMEFAYDDTEYTLYLDPNGYVIGLEGDTAAELEEIYLVTGLDTVDGKWGETTYVQAVALADGKIAEFVMGDAEDAKDYQTVAPDAQGLYTFAEKDGKYFAEVYEVDTDKVDAEAETTVKLAKDDTKFDGYYFTEDTLFIKVETDWAGDTTVKTTTAAISIDVEADDVIVVFAKDGKAKDAEIVLIAAPEINANLEASDIVYFKDNASTTNADGYEAEAYFMDGTGAIETITYKKADGKNVGGAFFEFSVDDDGIYDLGELTEELTGEYKDETGFVFSATLTKLYKNALSAYVYDGEDYVFTAEDVTLSDDVVIIDERTADERDADLYKTEITSASRLQAAINKTDAVVTGTVFFDDEEVIFIAVTEVTDAE